MQLKTDNSFSFGGQNLLQRDMFVASLQNNGLVVCWNKQAPIKSSFASASNSSLYRETSVHILITSIKSPNWKKKYPVSLLLSYSQSSVLHPAALNREEVLAANA